MIPYDPTEGFPQVDTAGLRTTAAWLKGAAGKMSADSHAVGSLVGSVLAGGAEWTGDAANTWEAAGRQRSVWYRQAGATWSAVAGVLSTVADHVDQARTAYTNANRSAMEAANRARDLSSLANMDPKHPNAGLLAQASSADQDVQTYTKAASQALSQAKDALQSATFQLGPLIYAASTCCPHPMTPGSHKANTLAPSQGWVVTLFGSVVGDNRMSGREFQARVLKDLGIKENTSRFTVRLDDGSEYTTIPDGVTDELIIEVKGVRYIYASRQLLAQIRLAVSQGKTPNLVVRNTTRVSSKLQDKIDEAGGKIYVRQADNSYREYGEKSDNPTLYRGNGKGGFEKVPENEPEPPGATGSSAGPGSGSGDDGSGGGGSGDNGSGDEPGPGPGPDPDPDPDPGFFDIP